MARHDELSGIARGLDLANIALQNEAENAFLTHLVAKAPYEPQRVVQLLETDQGPIWG